MWRFTLSLIVGSALALGCASTPGAADVASNQGTSKGDGEGTSSSDPGAGSNGACVALQEAIQREAKNEAENDARLNEGLAEKGLTRVKLTAQRTMSPNGADGPHEWRAEERAGKKWVLSPPMQEYCDFNADKAFRFAKDAQGAVFVIQGVPKVVRENTVTVCGCASAVPITCGGAMPPYTRFELALPEGTHFAGTAQVPWKMSTLQRTFSKDINDPTCPPMTAPP